MDPDLPRVVVVDDEPSLRRMVAGYLARHGFSVRTAADGRELDAWLAAEPAELVVLDLAMPGEDGFSIARRLRAAGATTPILLLTAAEELVDRVVGLELGADDYLTKPFDLRELLARVRAVLRRSGGASGAGADEAAVAAPPSATAPARPVPPAPAPAPPPPVSPGRTVRFGSMRLDLEGCRLLRDDGSALELTAMEFELLKAFAENPGRVLSRARLLQLAHDRDRAPFGRRIDNRIVRLRRKLEDDPARPGVIATVRGEGYVFLAPGG